MKFFRKTIFVVGFIFSLVLLANYLFQNYLLVNQKLLIGIWQDSPVMAAGWSNTYQFHNDGTFDYSASSMGYNDKARHRQGKWSLKKGKLSLVYLSKDVLLESKYVDPQSSPCGMEMKIAVKNMNELFENSLLFINLNDSIKEQADYPNWLKKQIRLYKDRISVKPMIKIGNSYYWKFEDDSRGRDGNLPIPSKEIEYWYSFKDFPEIEKLMKDYFQTENLKIKYDQFYGGFARITVNPEGGGDGNVFILFRVNNNWKIIETDGQAPPKCENIDLYDVPKDFYSQCLD